MDPQTTPKPDQLIDTAFSVFNNKDLEKRKQGKKKREKQAEQLVLDFSRAIGREASPTGRAWGRLKRIRDKRIRPVILDIDKELHSTTSGTLSYMKEQKSHSLALKGRLPPFPERKGVITQGHGYS